MLENNPEVQSKFEENYFSSEAYSGVLFDRYCQYWWSNRYYAMLVCKHGPDSGRVLELGCGMGHLLGRLVDQYEVYGTDINPWPLVQASHNVRRGRYSLLSAEDLGAILDRVFQIVIAKHVVEYFSNPENAISEIEWVLAPGGLLVLATPDTDSLTRAAKKEKWIGYQDPTHISLAPAGKRLNNLLSHNLDPRKVFSEGFWEAPYVPWLQTSFQKILFGAPGGLQAVFGWSIIPLRVGKRLIVLAEESCAMN